MAESGGGGSSNSSTTPLIAGLVSALVSTSLIAGVALFIIWRRKQKRNAQGLLGVPFMPDLGSPGAHSAYPDQHSAAPPNQAVYDRRNLMSEVDNTPMISASSPKRVVLSPPTPQSSSYPAAIGSATGSSAALLSPNPYDNNGQVPPPAYSG